MISSLSETVNNDDTDTSPRSTEETTKTRPRRSSVTSRSPISVRVVSPPPQTCLKCTRKSGKLVTCRNCNKSYHKTCVSAIEDTNLELATSLNDWLCLTCENTQLIEALEAKLGEIESNSWRVMVTCEEDEESGVSSDEEVDGSSSMSEQMRQQPRRPVINFDSPLKDGKS